MKQTLTDNKFGNCLQTCVAQLLGKPLNHIPNFMLFEKKWFTSLVMYLETQGYCPEKIENEAPPEDGNEYIVSLKFLFHSEGLAHAVIMKNGQVVFDPWPNINYSYSDSIISGYYKLIPIK